MSAHIVYQTPSDIYNHTYGYDYNSVPRLLRIRAPELFLSNVSLDVMRDRWLGRPTNEHKPLPPAKQVPTAPLRVRPVSPPRLTDAELQALSAKYDPQRRIVAIPLGDARAWNDTFAKLDQQHFYDGLCPPKNAHLSPGPTGWAEACGHTDDYWVWRALVFQKRAPDVADERREAAKRASESARQRAVLENNLARQRAQREREWAQQRAEYERARYERDLELERESAWERQRAEQERAWVRQRAEQERAWARPHAAPAHNAFRTPGPFNPFNTPAFSQRSMPPRFHPSAAIPLAGAHARPFPPPPRRNPLPMPIVHAPVPVRPACVFRWELDDEEEDGEGALGAAFRADAERWVAKLVGDEETQGKALPPVAVFTQQPETKRQDSQATEDEHKGDDDDDDDTDDVDSVFDASVFVLDDERFHFTPPGAGPRGPFVSFPRADVFRWQSAAERAARCARLRAKAARYRDEDEYGYGCEGPLEDSWEETEPQMRMPTGSSFTSEGAESEEPDVREAWMFAREVSWTSMDGEDEDATGTGTGAGASISTGTAFAGELLYAMGLEEMTMDGPVAEVAYEDEEDHDIHRSRDLDAETHEELICSIRMMLGMGPTADAEELGEDEDDAVVEFDEDEDPDGFIGRLLRCVGLDDDD
ncbi:hypothetical protein K488DRAFT_84915 [Vararia minispora EC-137]|uniref:Uncharacterized protein n=1 Tax=Vararia minispora EC-137 TaxID=1314806 RepID=A0ACB8QNN0_9AGAM|nr:hypothetical protein K488DRAFT_84915 [Vararia minispora EC-137]